jgi:hypothetical protein
MRLILGLLLAAQVMIAADAQPSAAHFQAPPSAVRPWVYWMWLSSNLTPASITADLEAMQRAGLGGALIMDVDQGTPAGPVGFASDGWYALVDHAVAEAARLGMQLTINNGPGYSGSGGPWVPRDQAIQRVFWSETRITGGQRWSGTLPKGKAVAEYRDIAVLAVAEPAPAEPAPAGPPAKRWQIPNLTHKAMTWNGWVGYSGLPASIPAVTPPAESVVPRTAVIDLSDRLGADDTLTWDAPPGTWTLLRFGHAWSGGVVLPAPPPAKNSPETDKLSAEATRLHVSAFFDRLQRDLPPTARAALHATHIDSWEGGGQNWTARMRAEFTTRRGYDPVPFLPVLASRVVGDMDTAERFLFDLRLTVSELMIQNYAREFRRLVNARGLRVSSEAYTSAGNDLDYADHADEPMAEFWTNHENFAGTLASMTSSAHLHRRTIVPAEAFTSDQKERWQLHPASLRQQANRAFAAGINRLVVHRYAAQRFPQVVPGMQMGPWGLHYERTSTWWDWSRAWHDQVARCQFMLRQGEAAADILELQPEEPLYRLRASSYPGYRYDAVGGDTFATATVRDGRIVFPSGAAYRLLVLPDVPGMSAARLERIRDLVHAGAAIVGKPPTTTLGLAGGAAEQARHAALVTEVWGDGVPEQDRRVGAGRVCTGLGPVQVLTRLGVPPALTTTAPVVWMHRTLPDGELYFIANDSDRALLATAVLRARSDAPSCWDPASGAVAPLRRWRQLTPDTGEAVLHLEPFQGLFVILPRAGTAIAPITAVRRDGTEAPPETYDPATGLVRSGGTWTVADAATTIPALPEALPVAGPWQVSFQAGRGAPPTATLATLVSLDRHPDPGVAAFSGEAVYRTTVEVPEAWLTAGRRVELDLGQVEIMARVAIAGRDLGLRWHPPYRFDITAALRPGRNDVAVTVVTTWVNRLIADARLPDVPERTKDNTLSAWPAWLVAGEPQPGPRVTFCSWNQWKPDEAFKPAGLIGPVRLVPGATVAGLSR